MNPEQFTTAVLGIVMTAMVGLIVYIWKSNREDQKEKLDDLKDLIVEARSDARELRGENKVLAERLVTEEKSTIRQDGQIARLDEGHDRLTQSLQSLTDKVATKDDIRRVERAIEALGTGQRRYSPESGGFQRVDPNKPPNR